MHPALGFVPTPLRPPHPTFATHQQPFAGMPTPPAPNTDLVPAPYPMLAPNTDPVPVPYPMLVPYPTATPGATPSSHLWSQTRPAPAPLFEGSIFRPPLRPPHALPTALALTSSSARPESAAPRRAVREERTQALVESECVVCIAEAREARVQVDVARLLDIPGLPTQLYFCDRTCAATMHGDRAGRPKGLRVKDRLHEWAATWLGTDLRVGDEVFLIHDTSSGMNVAEGDAVVEHVEFDPTQCAALLTCRYAIGGASRPRVYPTGLRRRVSHDERAARTRASSAASSYDPWAKPSPSESDIMKIDRLRTAAASQQHRAIAAEAAASTTSAALEEERQLRAGAQLAAQEATSRIERSERQASRADAASVRLRAELKAAHAELEDFDRDYDALAELEQRVQRKRAALERRVERLQHTADPQRQRRLQEQRSVLNSDLRRAHVDLDANERLLAERDAEIKRLRAELAGRQKQIWLPGLAGLGTGGAHDETTRLLWAKFLTLRAPPSEIAEMIASAAYAIASDFPEELKQMKLPSDNFARTMRPELGVLHQMISAVTVGAGETLCIANDASPLDGREMGATVARVKSIVNENVVLRDCHLAGCYETADPTSRGEALAIKEKSFDRCVASFFPCSPPLSSPVPRNEFFFLRD